MDRINWVPLALAVVVAVASVWMMFMGVRHSDDPAVGSVMATGAGLFSLAMAIATYSILPAGSLTDVMAAIFLVPSLAFGLRAVQLKRRTSAGKNERS